MQAQKQKEETSKKQKKKRSGKKALAITLGVIAVIVAAGVIMVSVMTKPVSATSDDAVYVGGMITSDTVDYKSDTTDGLEKNFIVKMMQFIWRFCYVGDTKKHADQTPADVVCKKDIAYIDDGNLYHQLDVFYPDNLDESSSLPVIIDIHGGGWMYATKDLNEYYCRALADRGYVVFSISYRLVPDVTVPEQLADVANALNWIDANMSNYPCDSENIMLTGDSAGGQLSIYSIIISQSDELQKTFGVPNVDMQFSALLLTSPVSYMKTGSMSVYTRLMWGSDYKSAATYEFMDLDEIIDYGTLPPTYLITSKADSMAHSQTLKAAELLESKGVKTVLKEYPRRDGKKLVHVYSVLYPYDSVGSEMIDGAMDFYNEIINEK